MARDFTVKSYVNMRLAFLKRNHMALSFVFLLRRWNKTFKIIRRCS